MSTMKRLAHLWRTRPESPVVIRSRKRIQESAHNAFLLGVDAGKSEVARSIHAELNGVSR